MRTVTSGGTFEIIDMDDILLSTVIGAWQSYYMIVELYKTIQLNLTIQITLIILTECILTNPTNPQRPLRYQIVETRPAGRRKNLRHHWPVIKVPAVITQMKYTNLIKSTC